MDLRGTTVDGQLVAIESMTAYISASFTSDSSTSFSAYLIFYSLSGDAAQKKGSYPDDKKIGTLPYGNTQEKK
ncbi:MAG: hypothetical protein WCR46_02330 [Deltaproteobacteria bacterium]